MMHKRKKLHSSKHDADEGKTSSTCQFLARNHFLIQNVVYELSKTLSFSFGIVFSKFPKLDVINYVWCHCIIPLLFRGLEAIEVFLSEDKLISKMMPK